MFLNFCIVFKTGAIGDHHFPDVLNYYFLRQIIYLLKRTFHKKWNWNHKSIEIHLQKRKNHSFLNYIPSGNIQRLCLYARYKTSRKAFLKELFQRNLNWWNNFRIFIKLHATELLLQHQKYSEMYDAKSGL